MNKFMIAALSFSVGALAGFGVGYFLSWKETEEVIETPEQPKEKVYADDIKKEEPVQKVDPAEEESPQDDDPNQLVSRGPAHMAMPGQVGVDYSKVQKIVKENGYTSPEEIQEVIDDPENEETYEEREEREALEASEAMSEYRKKNKGKIVPIQSDEWDTDFPTIDYEKKDLYYFTLDDVLTDEEGHVLDEAEYIGVKPRQFGWMSNSEDKIYIRNNPKETDFQVWKEKCASTDFFNI